MEDSETRSISNLGFLLLSICFNLRSEWSIFSQMTKSWHFPLNSAFILKFILQTAQRGGKKYIKRKAKKTKELNKRGYGLVLSLSSHIKATADILMPFYRLKHIPHLNAMTSLLNTVCQFSSWGCWSKMKWTVLFSFQHLPGDNKIRRPSPSNSILMVGFPDPKPWEVNVYWFNKMDEDLCSIPSADLYYTQLRYILMGKIQMECTIRFLLVYYFYGSCIHY